ncbi:MAG: type II toxin-antitoxin system RelE/ParE family toxin [Phormidesmis sp. CAN_BIN44]|nr:type II toxin-antitoxin system RelE/ParE family toxin [Phormidesmis sp. CAN_BIN44]
MTEPPLIQVLVAAEFQNQIRELVKRYRQIRSDVQGLIEQLKAGEFPGDQISGAGYTVFKVRVKNSDIRKGKSGGYRIIYQVLSPTIVLLLFIYAKSDRSNVTVEEIQSIAERFQPNLE